MRAFKSLYSSLLAVGLTAGSMSVYAQDNTKLPGLTFPDGIATYDAGTKAPGFNKAEEALHCAAESAVSLIAAHIAHVGCGETSYSVAIETALDGTGTLDIDPSAAHFNVDSNVDPNVKGVFCNVDAVQPASIGSTVLNGYEGRHAWSRNRRIFNSRADNILLDGVQFDEQNIKDFYKWTDGFIYDWGLEKITKFKYPRAKWWQWSKYRPEDGSLLPGTLQYWKKRLIPLSPSCFIHLNLKGTNDEGTQYSGTLTVSHTQSP